ncbi:hypothetical protein [Streptomyces longwoodensis]|uniref:hypothetical protein n=1 Tax=Streptomyces longwoodensis TaxID=68231 RepID=UPI00225A2CD6|nr:hypothetical protein [Streptomyces longwoodensis]MCX4998254.1 hypothetical protein [Streptomyces longwoodensis]
MPEPLRTTARRDEDVHFERVAGPITYRARTDKPVQYVTVANGQGAVLGCVWANDEDDAAGWTVRTAGGDEAFNRGALYVSRLRDAKARGISPTAALAELFRYSDPANPSHVVPGSLTGAPSLAALRERLAGD